MKSYFVLIFTLILSVSAIAQEQLSIKGIPVQGNVKKFVKQMMQKGLKKVEPTFETSTIFMEGYFISRNAVFAIIPDKDKNICKVSVTFNEQSSWDLLESLYYECKKMYTSKYGAPIAEEEVIEDDNYKYRNQVLGLHQGCVKFGTFYLAKGGSIGIMLIPIGTTKGAVMILYENDEVLMKQKLHDLNDI